MSTLRGNNVSLSDDFLLSDNDISLNDNNLSLSGNEMSLTGNKILHATQQTLGTTGVV